jgi:DNA-binding NarL/FixJ family response regulator
MHKAICIEDEKTSFEMDLLDELNKQGIETEFINWRVEAEKATDESGINFEKLIDVLKLEEYDLLIIDIMMPNKGIEGTYSNFLTGIKLHKKLIETSPSIIGKLKSVFITNLPNDSNTSSYYKIAENYVTKANGSLHRKGNPGQIAAQIKDLLRVKST